MCNLSIQNITGKCKRGERGLFVKDVLQEHRYVNTSEFKAVECVRIEAQGASPAYWSLRGIFRDNKREAVRLGKYRFEKQAVEALELLVARLNREARGGLNFASGIQDIDDEC